MKFLFSDGHYLGFTQAACGSCHSRHHAVFHNDYILALCSLHPPPAQCETQPPNTHSPFSLFDNLERLSSVHRRGRLFGRWIRRSQRNRIWYTHVVKVVLVLSMFSTLMTTGAFIYTVVIWKSGKGSIWGRVYYTVVMLALISTSWQLNHWNLLGFHY